MTLVYWPWICLCFKSSGDWRGALPIPLPLASATCLVIRLHLVTAQTLLCGLSQCCLYVCLFLGCLIGAPCQHSWEGGCLDIWSLCHPDPSPLFSHWKATRSFYPSSHKLYPFHTTLQLITICLTPVSPVQDPAPSGLTLFDNNNFPKWTSQGFCVHQALSSFHGNLKMWIFSFKNGLKHLLPYLPSLPYTELQSLRICWSCTTESLAVENDNSESCDMWMDTAWALD